MPEDISHQTKLLKDRPWSVWTKTYVVYAVAVATVLLDLEPPVTWRVCWIWNSTAVIAPGCFSLYKVSHLGLAWVFPPSVKVVVFSEQPI